MDADMCATAAAAGNLDILIWLRSLGCPWNASTAIRAFREGRLEILSWLAQQGCACPWESGPDGPASSSPAFSLWCGAFPGDASHRLLGRTLCHVSAAALRSAYKEPADCFQLKAYYLPEHLQHILDQRTAAVAAGHDTSYIDHFLLHFLARSKPLSIGRDLSTNNLPAQVSKIIVRSSHVGALAWLLENADVPDTCQREWHAMLCTEAAIAGQISMLELMKAQHEIFIPWDSDHLGYGRDRSVLLRMLLGGPPAASINWFRQQFPSSFSAELCRAAVGWPGVLQVLRGLQPPCPWDVSVSSRALAQCQSQTLAWLLNQDPPCPMELDHARKHPLTVVESGHLATLLQIWPVDASPQAMFERAACGGHRDMLQFLLDKYPEEQLGDQTVFLAAKHDNLDALVILQACRRQVLMPVDLSAVKGRCLVALAQAGHVVRQRDKRRIRDLLSPWATLIGLIRWANRVEAASVQGSLASSADQSSHEQLAPQGGNMLLNQLARLPYDIAQGIISQAVLTPAIADPLGLMHPVLET